MAGRRQRSATYEDLVAAPPDQIAELVEGFVYLAPRPAPRHSNATSVLTALLNDAFHQGRSGPGGWWILFEPEVHLGDDVLVPDIAGWRRERLSALPDTPWFDLAPDWVCEVISPSTEAFDRDRKMPIYAAAGVGHLWIVDPEARTVEIHQRDDAGWRRIAVHSGAEKLAAEPFDALAIALAALWA